MRDHETEVPAEAVETTAVPADPDDTAVMEPPATVANVGAGDGGSASVPGLDDSEAVARAFYDWWDGGPVEWPQRGFLAGWAARPRAVVLSAASEADATKLAFAVAVAQEVAILLDAVDRRSLDAVDLSGWSRLRAVAEMWWITCGWTAEDLDSWTASLSGSEIAPGVPPAAGGDGERRLVQCVKGRGHEVPDEYDRLAATQAPAEVVQDLIQGLGEVDPLAQAIAAVMDLSAHDFEEARHTLLGVADELDRLDEEEGAGGAAVAPDEGSAAGLAATEGGRS